MKVSFSPLLTACLGTAAGFRPLGISSTVPRSWKLPSSTPTTLFAAEGGAPQYRKHEGILQRAENVGMGSYLLHIKYSDFENLDDETKAAIHYQPGNVLALEIQPPSDGDTTGVSSNSIVEYTAMNEKTQKDLDDNEGWLRGPYTVTRGSADGNNELADGFQVLIKQVGYKSNVMATAAPNTPVRFGGKFKVPIVDGILNNLEVEGKTERVVMISTGVGVGPCVGAIELLLNDKDSPFQGKINFLASFRTKEEVAMAGDLKKLAARYPRRFEFKSIITSEVGRLSQSAESLESSLASSDNICSIQNTHYHVIGNGQLINEWKAGLEQAGAPKERVTVEAYFNHRAEADALAVEAIASTIKKLEVQEAQLLR